MLQKKSWKEKIFKNKENVKGKKVIILGMRTIKLKQYTLL